MEGSMIKLSILQTVQTTELNTGRQYVKVVYSDHCQDHSTEHWRVVS